MGGRGGGGLLVAGTVTVVTVTEGGGGGSTISDVELILEVLAALQTQWNFARSTPGNSPCSHSLGGLLQGQLGLTALRLALPPDWPLLLLVLLPRVGVAAGLLRALAVIRQHWGRVRAGSGSDDVLHVERQLGHQHGHLGGVRHPGGIVQLRVTEIVGDLVSQTTGGRVHWRVGLLTVEPGLLCPEQSIVVVVHFYLLEIFYLGAPYESLEQPLSLTDINKPPRTFLLPESNKE